MKPGSVVFALLFIATLCNASMLFAQSDGQQGVALPPAAITQASLLTLPGDGRPTKVRAAFHLRNINWIDDETETFEFSGVLTLTWQDPRQAFDPAIEGIAEKIYQGAYQFNELSPAWYPQVVLANEVGVHEKDAVLLRVKSDGTSTLVETVNAVAKTKLNLRRYPYDSQHLEAVFEVLGVDTGEVSLEAEPIPGRSRGHEIRIPQWKLSEIGVSIRNSDAPYAGSRGVIPVFVLTVDVQRQSLFMLRLVVLPLILIVILSWSVFWMERSSLGERMDVSFVGILTVVAYQILISEILPHISYVTLIHAFLSLSFFFMCLTVVVNLVVGVCDKNGNFALGDRIDLFCRWGFPSLYVVSLASTVVIMFVYL